MYENFELPSPCGDKLKRGLLTEDDITEVVTVPLRG